MITLLFEVVPRPGMANRYFDMAAELKGELDRNRGLVFIDRYESLSQPGHYLSHQIWQDEASVASWRANAAHHGAQSSGRRNVLADYRLRVGEVIAARGPESGPATMPTTPYNDPNLRSERFVVVVLSTTSPMTDTEGQAYRSVYHPGEFAWVTTAASRRAGLALLDEAASYPQVRSARLTLVSRDYTMHERAEAPQFFPAVNTWAPGSAGPGGSPTRGGGQTI